MNFYNEDEDKKGAPVIPGAASPFKKTSAFGKTPMFSRATGSIIDRLKNLSRKDMAFVGIGLSVLVMAPVAEYMMSQPAQDNLLRETFNPRSGPGGVMDPGINGLSTGSSDGSGEVITPLSSRDPMSLILGAQPAAAVMPPPSAPPTTSYRDAMKESGRAAFSEASKSAGAPTVIPRLQAALRGISSFGGDSGGSRTSGVLGGGKIIDDARSASSKAKSRSMLGPVAMAGYKGVASTPNSASKGAFEKLRAQADKSAGNFSGGSAMNSLDKAAADAANISGAGGLGAGGDSEKTGKPSGSTTKYDHNRSGETLAEAAAKARQAKALEWEFFKKYEFKKQLLTAVFGAISTEVGKFVSGAVGGAINPAAPAPPTSYCWSPKSNPSSVNPADCAGGVVKTPIFKDKDGKPYTYPEVYKCICGIGPNANSGAEVPPIIDPGTDTDSGTGTGQMPSAVPVDTAKELEAYDAALVQMAEEALGGDAATEPKKLLGHAKAAAASMAKCADIAKRLATNIQTKTPEQVGREKQTYSAAISKARIDVTLTRQKYNAFANRLTTEISKLEGGQKIVKDGKETVQMGNVDTLAVLKAIKSDADSYERSSIAVAEKKLAFHEKAITQYDNQSADVTSKAGEVSITANGRLGNLTVISDGLKAIKEDAITADDLTKIKGDFLALTGKKAESVQAPAPPANPVTGATQGVAKEVGTVVAGSVQGTLGTPGSDSADSVPFLASAIAWRGAEEQKLWSEKKADDTLAKKTEGETWLKLSPYKRLESGKFEDTSFPAGPVAKDVVSMSIRGIVVLPFDMKGSQGYLPEITLGMGMLDTNLTKWKEQLKQAGLDFDSTATTPGTNPGTNPGTTPAADPLTGRQTALLATSRNNASEYEAATAVHEKLGQGTNATYARADYKKMTDSHANIVRLTNELSAPGAKPTKEKLDELEMYQTNFGKAYGDFQTHAKAAGTPVPQPKPQPTQVNIYNTVGATANSSSVSGATVNNKPPVINNTVTNTNNNAVNNTNNNAVNNTTQPKPPVQPQQPQAKPAQPTFSLPMSGGTSVLLNTPAGNTGLTAVYTGGHRSGMSWLYKYEVVCKRQKNTEAFVVHSVQRTKSLFTTGVTVGGPEAVTGFSGRSCQ